MGGNDSKISRGENGSTMFNIISKEKVGKPDFFFCDMQCFDTKRNDIMNGILNGKNGNLERKRKRICLSIDKKCRWQHLFTVSRFALQFEIYFFLFYFFYKQRKIECKKKIKKFLPCSSTQ